ncbi:DUF4190 domain-containing protein [Terribacillus saccharophilus]|uniref:DUF4190 domain-containing protein n=1 Tax=Terribacillus saccharophilus TaxID=361277 RepID=UPI003982A230
MSAQKYIETEQTEKQGYSFEAVFTLMAGLISIVGIILVGKGGIHGLIGLIWAYMAHLEIKRHNKKGRNIMVAGIVCCLIGLVSNFI